MARAGPEPGPGAAGGRTNGAGAAPLNPYNFLTFALCPVAVYPKFGKPSHTPRPNHLTVQNPSTAAHTMGMTAAAASACTLVVTEASINSAVNLCTRILLRQNKRMPHTPEELESHLTPYCAQIPVCVVSPERLLRFLHLDPRLTTAQRRRPLC